MHRTGRRILSGLSTRTARRVALLAMLLVLVPAASAAAYPETTGPGPTHTFTNYHDATGQGASIPDNSTVQVACRAEGFRVEDGDTWWYQIASSPWNYAYWASADAFYNDGRTSGSLKGTPPVDPNVPVCIPPAPAVATGGASGVSQGTATLSGSVNPEGGNVSSCEFEYGTSPSYGESVACSSLPGSGTSPVGVSATAGGLTPNSTYYYRIVATNAGGTSYGSGQAFATLPNAPAVATGAASDVSQEAATLNAGVDPEGAEVSSCQFEYGTSEGYGSSVPCSPSPGAESNAVAISGELVGLKANTTYFFRIVATNAGGTSYGTGEAFTTPVDKPAVLAGEPSSLGQVSATLHATVNPNEGDVTECQFEYGTSESYGSTSGCVPPPGEGTTAVAVSTSLSGLTPGTTYHFRIVATSAGGTTYSTDETFETASPMLPELGRCLPRAGDTGKYKTSTCTTKSAAEDSGPYEWQPWPAGNDRFTAQGGAATFETVHKSTIKCSDNATAGEYTSSRTLVAVITFTNCAAPGALGGKCQSEGAPAGEIVMSALEGELGVVKAGRKPTVGWILKAASGPLATFKCGESNVSVTGSVIAPTKSVDAMTTAMAWKLKATKGKQRPERLLPGTRDILSFVTTSAEEQAGLTMTDSVTSTEPLEIKAIA
jgi:hypothetical protein